MVKNIIGLSFLLLVSGVQRSWGQVTKFNDNWQFKGVEFMDKNRVDSFRKLGVNWSDQFKIEKENVEGASLSSKDTMLSAVLETVEKMEWQSIRLPHTAFPEPLVIVKPREGVAFYRKRFFLDKKLTDKDISIEFEGVMQVSDIWVNGRYAGRHEGGYLPFVIELSGMAVYGRENEIVLRVNNQANPIVPPGKPVQKLDFVYYSGIYRDVFLQVKNRLHVTNAVNAGKPAGGGIFVTYPLVTKEKAVVEVQTDVQNNYQQGKRFIIQQEILDKNGKRVVLVKSDPLQLEPKGDKQYVQSLKMDQPSLWHPDHPVLYTLKTSILSDGVVTDSRITKIGIRSFEITKEKGLLINGEPYRLVGTNRHQNYPYIGNALSNEASYRDAWLIKSAGMNAVRLAHYPQGAAFLDAADELGILIIDCIPGWQFFNKHPSFEANVMKDIRQMVRTDRNHPSILLWETSLNETYPDSAFRCKQAEVAREEWRGTANFFTSGDSYFTKACWDVPYDDWNGDPGNRNNTTYKDNAFLIREYGDYEFGGGNSSTRQLRGAGENGMLEQAWNLQWEHNKNRKSYPHSIGDLTWAFYDGLAGCVVGIEGWGVADIFRIPKYSYYFFKSQQPPVVNKDVTTSTGPVIFIASNWDQPTADSKVIVYSNCDSVTLLLNGRKLRSQKPDGGPETSHEGRGNRQGLYFNGGNANNLEHPPFTFGNIAYAPGTLTAVGFRSGKVIAQQSVTTPGKAYKAVLETGINGKAFNANGDVIFVYVKLVDEHNNMVSVADLPVTLHVSGDAELVSPESVKAEAGIATFLLRSGHKKGTVTLNAVAPGINSGHLNVIVN